MAKNLAVRETLASVALQGPLGPKERQKLMFSQSLIGQMRTIITPPLVAGADQAETDKIGDKFLAENAPGTRFLWFDHDNQRWVDGIIPEGTQAQEPLGTTGVSREQ